MILGLNLTMIKNKNTISLCMIVKNEEKFLSNCLKSIENFVNEIIIVDTGSTDKTIEIAKSFNSKLYYYEWDDNFSNARNFSIEKATMDWILVLDADETLSTINQKIISREINSKIKNVAYMLNTINESSTGVDIQSFVPRLFPNRKDIYFENPIHEQITGSLEKINYNLVKSRAKINHVGYNSEKVDQDKKQDRNIKLLLKAYRKKKYWYYAYQLGISYKIKGNAKLSKKYFIEAVKLNAMPHFMSTIYNYLGELMNDEKSYKDALTFLEKSISITPFQILGYIQLFHTYYELGRFSACESLSTKLLDIYPDVISKGSDLSNDNMIPIHEIFRRLGASSYKLNDLDKSKKYFEKAYKEIKKTSSTYRNSENGKNQYLEILKNIIGISRQLNNPVDAIDYIEDYIIKDPNNKDSYLLLGDAYTLIGKHNKALDVYLSGNSIFNDNDFKRKIAAQYIRLDNAEEAEKWVYKMAGIVQ